LIADIAPTLNASFGKKLGLENQHIDGGAGMFIAHAPRADGFDASEDGTGRGTPLVYQCQGSNVGEMGALRAGNGNETGMQVRRLTPRECARLQGFPDDYLDITYRGKPAADGNKYRALGNSMAVPVISWIGRRIQLVDSVPYPDQSEQPRDAEANTRPAQVSDGPARALEGTGTHGG
jgi:site-specific DNA-cytosine methylase